jgi:hypothetical protein
VSSQEGKPRFNIKPIGYVLTVSADEMAAEGFGKSDIKELFAWQDGKCTPSPERQRRLKLLEMMVLRTVKTTPSQDPPGV